MNGSLLEIFVLSLAAMLNPSLLAALTVMLLLPSPKRLMFGYLLGAYLTSITAGLLIVFALQGSGTESTSRHQIGPVQDLLVGLLCFGLAWVLKTGRDQPLQERRRRKKERKLEARLEAGKPAESMPMRLLRRGDPRLTFVVGALLSFPGVSYLAALDRIHKLAPGTVPTVLLIVAFCLIELLLLELPILGYLFAPDRTNDAVERLKAWTGRSGRTIAAVVLVVLGAWLLIRGVVTL